MRWTSRDIAYLEEHAADGACAIAAKLKRTESAVRHQASRCGLSLRIRWRCPNCGQDTFKPLSAKTGWCQICTKRQRIDEIAAQVAAMEDEKTRSREVERQRQRLYSKKNRLKKIKNNGITTEH